MSSKIKFTNLIIALSVILTSTLSSKVKFSRSKIASKIIGDDYTGFQIIRNKIQRLRSIVCNSSVGPTPGKLTDQRKVYFSFNGRQYICHNVNVLTGKRIPNKGVIPPECRSKAYKTADHRIVYPVIVFSRHGEIPGKAYDPAYGYYGYDKGQYRRPNFVWYC